MLRDVMHNIQVVESYLLKSPHTNGGTSVPFSFKNKINVIFTRVLAICGILVWSWALHPHFIQQIQLLRSLRSKRHFSFWSLLCFVMPRVSPVCLIRHVFVLFLWSGHVRSVIVQRLRPLLFPGLCICSPLSVLPELFSPVYIICSPSYLWFVAWFVSPVPC